MPKITNFVEAQAALRPLYQNARTLYNLDTMRALMAHVGNPQNKLKVIHVAGTSGKTSTTYYIAALLRAQGFKVGHTVSPHVDCVNERVQIDGAPLSEKEFCATLTEFLELVERAGVQPSYFELLAAMVYWEFERRGVDYAVIEVGMGGEMDATNVISSEDKVCVITDIGLDHTEILGDTLAKIAWFKAGIIVPSNEVFMYRQGEDVMQVVRKVALERSARIHELDDNVAIVRPSLPLFQQRNLGLACQVVDYINQRDGHQALTDETVARAADTKIPARLERFIVNNKTVVVDGSHNQQKTEALLGSVHELYPHQDIAVLCAFVAGNAERWQGALDTLMPQVKTAIFTTFHGEQDLPRTSVGSDEIVKYCEKMGFTNYLVVEQPAVAMERLLSQPEQLLLVTGSFYLLNHVRPYILSQS